MLDARRTVPPPRLLFVPVSGQYGMGEYARSRAIARGVLGRWPEAQIHFLLSREASYAGDGEFACTLLASSPTFQSPAVVAAIEDFRPHAVIFDNAGRTIQLEAARRIGARVVYISARARQRRKAFRWRWMKLIDEHWIAYPEFIAGSLGPFERLKLRLLGRPVVRYLDVFVSTDEPRRAAEMMNRHALVEHGYILLVPGAGTGHADAAHANDAFARAAQTLGRSGHRCVLVAPFDGAAADAGAAPDADFIVRIERQDPVTLHALMRRALLVVTNGGGTMLQSMACGALTLAVPIAKDQVERVRRCAASGLVERADLDAAAIARCAQGLLNDASAQRTQQARVRSLELSDGLARALSAIELLLDEDSSTADKTGHRTRER